MTASRIVLIGVGHIFRIGPQIRSVILRESPNVVGLELDEARLASLIRPAPARMEAPAGTSGAYRRLAEYQASLAKRFGVQVGTEMRSALDAARETGAEVALIDLNAERMVDKIRREMGLGERVRFVWELLRARFARNRPDRLAKEVARVEADPQAAIRELGRRFPTVERILIDERDAHMANRIRDLAARHARVIAVVGDGHVPGIAKMLGPLDPVLIRLKDLRKMPAPETLEARLEDGGSRAHFGFEVRL